MSPIADDIKATAQQLMSARMAVVDELVEAKIRLGQAEDAITSARSVYSAAVDKAQKAGWTSAELRKLGVQPPAQSQKRRTTTSGAGQ